MSDFDDVVDPTDEAAEPEIETEQLNPWLSMWTKPRATVRQLVAQGPDVRLLVVASLTGITETLGRMSDTDAGDTMSVSILLALAVLLGPAVGIGALYVGAWLTRVTGRWLGGQAESRELRIALGWGGLPSATTLILWLFAIGVMGSEMFTSVTPDLESNLGLAGFLMLFGIGVFVLAVWSVFLASKAVAEVQGWASAWRGFGNILLSGLIILVPVIMIGIFAAIMIPALL
jgi:hypothetical protein